MDVLDLLSGHWIELLEVNMWSDLAVTTRDVCVCHPKLTSSIGGAEHAWSHLLRAFADEALTGSQCLIGNCCTDPTCESCRAGVTLRG